MITDRVDRRRAVLAMDLLRGTLTVGVAVAVLGAGSLPGPDQVESIRGTRFGLYVIVLLASVLLGLAEVLRDSSAQTLMPGLVSAEQLGLANGRLWAAENVMDTFAGPPLGSLLLLAAFAAPFMFDAVTFFVPAALLATIPDTFRAERETVDARASFRAELSEGVRWLRSDSLLRPMAVILGLLNLASAMSTALLVVFAQEVLRIGPLLFGVLGFGAALGGVVGGSVASWTSARFGSGACLAAVLGGCGLQRPPRGCAALLACRCDRFRPGLAARHPVERDHRPLAPNDHPRAVARAGEQRLSLSRKGWHAGRCGARWPLGRCGYGPRRA